MHILHVVASVSRRSGGLGAAALGLVSEQRTLGHEATIWCLDSPESAAETAHAGGLRGALVTYGVLGPHVIGYSPWAERAAGTAPGNTYAILHQHSIWMADSRVTHRWRSAFGRPTVIAPHGALEGYALARSAWKKRLVSLCYEARNLRLASCLHATAEEEARSFRRYGLVNPIAVIPNGIPEDWVQSCGDGDRFRRRHAIPADRRVLLFLSRIHPKKGLPLLFEAMAPLQQQLDGWCLAIAGTDELSHQAELEQLAEKLGISGLVRFLGPLFGADKRDAFAAADLFVLPTHSENFGIVVPEALAAGVPVLTTRGAPWEELQTRNCGWWVGIDSLAIRDALLDAIQRPQDELRAMGERGRALVAGKYTWARSAQRSLALYDWLLGHGERPNFVIVD